MNNSQTSVRDILLSLSRQDFLRIGISEIAYVRPIELSPGDRTAFAIYAADGTQLSVLDSMDMAVATLRHNDLIPATLH